jgi:ankyrin repeat protein
MTKYMVFPVLIFSSGINTLAIETPAQQEQKKCLHQELLNKKFLETIPYGKVEEVRRLLKNGADINTKDEYGSTALHKAATFHNLKVIEQLLEDGAEINIKNNFNETPLLAANSFFLPSERGHKTASELIKKGADVNAQNRRGETTAHQAAYQCDYIMLQILAENNADLAKRTGYFFGKTPLDIVYEQNSKLQSVLDEQEEKYKTLKCDESDELCSDLEKKIATAREAIHPCQVTIEFLEAIQNKQ